MEKRNARKISLLSVCIVVLTIVAGFGVVAFGKQSAAHAQSPKVSITPQKLQISGKSQQLSLQTYKASKTTKGAFTQFTLPDTNANPLGITKGPDGAIWFVDYNSSTIDRIGTDGSVKGYQWSSGNAHPYEITTTSDGSLWFNFSDGGVSSYGLAHVTTSGYVTNYQVPASVGVPGDLTRGPDGALWFSNFSKNLIANISNSGTLTLYTLPLTETQSVGLPLAAGSDGAIWFGYVQANHPVIGRLTKSGSFTNFALPAAFQNQNIISSIAAGSDGALWFSANNPVGRITTGGTAKAYALPGGITSTYTIINLGNNKLAYASNMYADHGSVQNYIVVLSTNGTQKTYTLPQISDVGTYMAEGNNNTIWYTSSNIITEFTFA